MFELTFGFLLGEFNRNIIFITFILYDEVARKFSFCINANLYQKLTKNLFFVKVPNANKNVIINKSINIRHIFFNITL